jgi:hypothetical protein
METTNYGRVTKQWIIENNPLYLERMIFKPIGALNEMNSLIDCDIIRYYRDGRMEKKSTYTTNRPIVEGMTILNAFGTKMMDTVKNNLTKGDCENDQCDCVNDN